MSRSGPLSFVFVLAAISALAVPVAAQVPAPQPVETKELPAPSAPAAPSAPVPVIPAVPAVPAPDAPPPPPVAGPAPAAPPAVPAPQAPPPAASVVPAPTAPASPFLVPPPADASVPDQVVLVSRPALVLKGRSSWEEGYERLSGAFRKLEEEAKKAALAANGKPVTLFTETDDQGFRYEALLPVESLPAQRPATMAPEVRLGGTPEGRAIRFVHQAPYDDIDSTYEAITAYLDLKGIEVKDTLIEEYANFGKDASDPSLEVYIYVQPRK